MIQQQSIHLGYTAAEAAESVYARYFRPTMTPLPEHVREAVATGGIAEELMPGLEHAPRLQEAGDWEIETGLTLCRDGEARIFVRTPMPGVTPAMWDWWFAWHGSEDQRYKLWHPRAHVSASWRDGRGELDHYVGRTSRVVEYIGATLLTGDIRFVAPQVLGIDETAIRRDGETAICARIGHGTAPADIGWLVHHVRPVPGGAEMRSRFWIGGRHVALRGVGPKLGRLAGRVVRGFQRATIRQASDLLVHCAQEMNHLAAILPELHAEFAGSGARHEAGREAAQ
jgi:hypothetical protein